MSHGLCAHASVCVCVCVLMHACTEKVTLFGVLPPSLPPSLSLSIQTSFLPPSPPSPPSFSLSDEGGHPDGSPLLRLTNKQGGRIGKKHHHSSVYQEGGGHEDYEGVGHGSSGTKTVMLICTPSGYGEDSTGTALMGKKEKTGRGSGASFGGADIYQDYNHTYSFSVHAATSVSFRR